MWAFRFLIIKCEPQVRLGLHHAKKLLVLGRSLALPNLVISQSVMATLQPSRAEAVSFSVGRTKRSAVPAVSLPETVRFAGTALRLVRPTTFPRKN
jgi:hypothetical protein